MPSNPAAWGSRVVYVLRRTDAEGKRYKSSLWAVPVAGGEAVRLTAGEWADRQPMPHGESLYFVSDRERGEQVWRLRASGGEAERVSSFGHGGLGAGAVSPDGKTLAIVFSAGSAEPVLAVDRVARPAGDDGPGAFAGATEGEPEWKALDAAPVVRVYARAHTRTDGAGWESGFLPHLWLLDLATGAARRITSGSFAYGAPAWYPDGQALVATRVPLPDGDREPTRNQLVRVALDGGVEVLPKVEGVAEAPSVSEAGRVAYIHGHDGDMWGARNPLVGIVEPDGSARLLGAALDRPVGDWALDDLSGAAFSPWAPLWDGDGVIVVATDRACTRLLRLGLDGSHRWLTPHGPCVSSPVRVGEAMVGLQGFHDRFLEVARVDGDATVMSRHNDALAADLAPRVPESVEVVVDGVTVQGWYLAARGRTTPGPAVLYVHGGPHTAYGTRLFFEMQWLADEGFAVTWTNPRGSHSFGEAYAACIDPHWGDPDARDQLAFVEHMAARPEVDAARVGITGGSYGGFMTIYMTAHHQRFSAAVADRGLYDWALDAAGGDFGHALPETFGVDLPWRDPAPLMKYSLLRVAHQVRCPTLIVHGDLDLRCDRTQATALYETLLRAGVTTALCLYPEENHGLSRGGRLDRRKERMRQSAAWFRRFL